MPDILLCSQHACEYHGHHWGIEMMLRALCKCTGTGSRSGEDEIVIGENECPTVTGDREMLASKD